MWGSGRARTSNWSDNEVNALVDTYYELRDVMRSVKHGGDPTVSLQKKEAAWQQICSAVYESGDGHVVRNTHQVKKKWENIVFRHKTIIINYKRKFKNGSDTPPPTLDPISTKIWDIYGMDNPMFKVDETKLEKSLSQQSLIICDTASLSTSYQHEDNSVSSCSPQQVSAQPLFPIYPTERTRSAMVNIFEPPKKLSHRKPTALINDRPSQAKQEKRTKKLEVEILELKKRKLSLEVDILELQKQKMELDIDSIKQTKTNTVVNGNI